MNCNHNEQSNSSYDKEVLQLFTFNQCEEVPIFEGEKNKMRYLIICPLCAKEPSYHKPSNGSSLIAPNVHFNCTSCQYQWILCRLCCYDKQPRFPKKRDQRRSLKNVYSSLMNSMKKHTEENHQDLDNNFNANIEGTETLDLSYDNSNSFFDESILSLSHDSSSTDEYNKALIINLKHTFPDVPGNTYKSKHNAHIRNLIYNRTTKKSFTQELILDKWLGLNGEEYSISKQDCDLFLRIVRQILLNSREEQSKIVDIYTRIENRNKEENEKLRNEITKLRQIVEEQRQKMNEICSTYGIDNSQFNLHNIPSTSECDQIAPLEKGTKINKMPLPLTLKDTRKITRSFVTGLVCPQVHKHFVDGYAYVLPSEVLPIAIANGIKFEHYNVRNDNHTFNGRSIFQARYIKEIVNKFNSVRMTFMNDSDDEEKYLPTLYVPLGLWSDGCDTGSASKANRNLVKLTTLHFVNPQINEEHVFPVGLGDHNGNHDYIRNKLMDDLADLTNSIQKYYVPSFNQLVKIKFFVAYVIQDRVEHCEFTGFSGHNGLCSTVPTLSCPIKMNVENDTSAESTVTLLKQIQSCPTCFERRFLCFSEGYYDQAVSSTNDCSNCYDWNLHKVQYVPPEDYPMEIINGNNNLLTAKEITFESMRRACEVMFEKLYLHEWTKAITMRYAQVECVKNSIVDDIYRYVKNIRPRSKRFAQRPIPLFPRKLLTSGMNQRLFTLDQCMVGIMHTLILNLGKHLLLTAVAWLSETEDWTRFYNSTNGRLKKINKLSLSWCKCYHYGSRKNPGSMWVSENYLGFAYVSKSIFSFLNEKHFNYDIIFDVFWLYNSIICHVMQSTLPTIDLANRVGAMTRLFLSFFNVLDNSIEKRVASKIETAACVISVLSLNKEMVEKGMQRNYWEGGWFGEGFFRSIKPLITRGTHQMGVFISTMNKAYHLRGINEMIDNDNLLNDEGVEIDTEPENNDLFDVSRYRRFHCYSKLEQVHYAVDNIDPLASFYNVNSKKFYICFYQKQKLLLELELQSHSLRLNTNTFKVTIGNVDNAKPIKDISCNSKDYLSVLMLPLCFGNGDDDVAYYAISETHLEYFGDNVWEMPKILLDTSTFDDLNTNNRISINSINIYDSIDKLKELVGMEVEPIDGSTSGIITSCYFVEGGNNDNNARWVASYYTGEEVTENIVQNITYTYDEMMTIINEERLMM